MITQNHMTPTTRPMTIAMQLPRAGCEFGPCPTPLGRSSAPTGKSGISVGLAGDSGDVGDEVEHAALLSFDGSTLGATLSSMC